MSRPSHDDGTRYTLAALAELPRWIAWQSEPDGDRPPRKIPYAPRGGKAKSDDPTTWGTRDDAEARFRRLDAPLGIGGVGFELGIVGRGLAVGGIDLDTCLAAGEFEPWAVAVLERFDSYAEISPSGTGAKVFFRYDANDLGALRTAMGKHPGEGSGKKWARANGKDHPPGIELYLDRRYFAVTGRRLEEYPDELRLVDRDTLLWLINEAGPALGGVAGNGHAHHGPPHAGAPDQSRSATAMRLGARLKREGKTYAEMCDAIAQHPETAGWYHEKGVLHGGRELRRIWDKVELPPPPPVRSEIDADARPLLPLVWFEEIEPVFDAAEFVEGLLVSTAMAVVYGDSNTGKTFLAIDLALHVAAGKEWMGRAVEQGGVVYCALEGGFGVRNRIAAWKIHHGCVDAVLPFALIATGLDLHGPAAHTDALIAAIGRAAEKFEQPVKLLFIDTLARAMAGGNENASEDMGAFVANVDRIRQAVGCAVVIIHHTGKNQAMGARGHSSLRAATDTEIEIRKDPKSSAIVATATKQRDFEAGKPFGFKLETVELGDNKKGRMVTSCVCKPLDEAVRGSSRKRTVNEAQMTLEALTEQVRQAIDRYGEVTVPEPGMPAVSVITRDTLRDWLVRRGLLSLDDDGTMSSTTRSRFHRDLRALVAARVITVSGDQIWLPKRRSDATD